MARSCVLILTALLMLSGASPPVTQDVQGDVDRTFAKVKEAGIDDIWTHVPTLEKFGRTALTQIRKRIDDEDPKVSLVASIVMYRSNFRDPGLDGLKGLIKEGPSEIRRAATHASSILVTRDLDRNRARKERFQKFLREEAKKAVKGPDRKLATALWLAYWRLTRYIEPRRAIKDDIFEKSTDPEVRDDAALALAEMDAFSRPVRHHLRAMSLFPTAKGKLAASYLRLAVLQDLLAAESLSDQPEKVNEVPEAFKLLQEIYDVLKANHVDPSKVDLEKLVTNAARGMAAGIDPYTAYYDEEMIRRLREEDLEGRYGGIGARVSMRKDRAGVTWLTIVEPIFSGPAYKAGLRSGDMIVSVEGESSANQDLQALVRKLRGKEGTTVKFKVFSRRWRENREFEIVRAQIQLETTPSRMLPGGIGYIRLTTFGERNTREVKAALQDLKDDGMRGLVLDLRGNSGGYLRTSVQIADLFLPRGALVVSSREREGPPEEYRARRTAQTDVPMVVLVDDMSASASEILAGALQAHKRAVVVGKRTFGKGSVQKLKALESTEGKTAVRITVARWYLEGDVSVEKDDPEKNGIEPDLTANLPERDFWLEAEADRLRSHGKIAAYLSKNFESNKKLFGKLADYDDRDPGSYPGFDALYKSLETKADKMQVREVLRDAVRRRVADARGKAFAVDYEEDTVLQQGILKACLQAGVDHKKVKEYKDLSAIRPEQIDPDQPNNR